LGPGFSWLLLSLPALACSFDWLSLDFSFAQPATDKIPATNRKKTTRRMIVPPFGE
jgi:hypothetical protein